MTDKSKTFGSSNRNLNNFLKAPPPPRNKSLKHSNQSHVLSTVDHSSDKSSVYSALNSNHNKRTYVEATAATRTTNELIGQHSSGFIRPDASSQAISDMGNIVANIDVNVANGQPLSASNVFHNNNQTKPQALGSSLNMNPNVSLDSSLNLCSSLGVNSQPSLGATRTAFVTSNSLTSSLNSSPLSSTVAVVGTSSPSVAGVKEILPAPIHGKIPVTPVTSPATNTTTLYKGTQVTCAFSYGQLHHKINHSQLNHYSLIFNSKN